MNQSDILRLLKDIEEGTVQIEAQLEDDSLSSFYGEVTFNTDNGWKFIVFFDCGEWDYLDTVISPDGDEMDYGMMGEGLMFYSPPENVRKEIYNSPGYLGCYRKELM